MKEMTLRIEPLSDQAFGSYGEIIAPGSKNLFIDYPDGSAFHVLAQASSTGWRLAMLRLRTRHISELQVHRGTTETLNPVQGVAVLCVASTPAPEGLKAFILDRPVLVYTDVWHNILTLSEESLIEIAENSEVDAEEVPLNVKLVPALMRS